MYNNKHFYIFVDNVTSALKLSKICSQFGQKLPRGNDTTVMSIP